MTKKEFIKLINEMLNFRKRENYWDERESIYSINNHGQAIDFFSTRKSITLSSKFDIKNKRLFRVMMDYLNNYSKSLKKDIFHTKFLIKLSCEGRAAYYPVYVKPIYGDPLPEKIRVFHGHKKLVSFDDFYTILKEYKFI